MTTKLQRKFNSEYAATQRRYVAILREALNKPTLEQGRDVIREKIAWDQPQRRFLMRNLEACWDEFGGGVLG